MTKMQKRASKTRQPVRARRSITERVLSWPRYGRMGLVILGVVTLAFALQGVVGELYTRFFDTTAALSTISWIVAAICLGMYMAGYVFIVGTPGVSPQPGRPQSIYLMVTFVLVAISLVWFVARTASALA